MSYPICMDCARVLDHKHKGSFGLWEDICCRCGQKKMCADSAHDFGIYESEEERLKDMVQDKI